MSLPSGYTKLQWIESTGTQWADTGFKPNQNTRIVMDADLRSFNSTDAFLFGARIASGNTAFCLAGARQNDKWYALYGNSVQTPADVCIGRHTIDFNKNVLTLDDLTISFSAASFQSAYNLLLFAAITNGSVDAQRGNIRIYSCQIYDNGTLVRDFIPCKNASGTVGLWDDVGSQFYGNAGTGTFTAGPEALEPPTAPTNFQSVLAVVLSWTAAERAESYKLYRDGTLLGTTTATQWVDTTVEPNETYVYSIKAVNAAGESAATEVTVYTKAGYFEYKPVITDANFQ